MNIFKRKAQTQLRGMLTLLSFYPNVRGIPQRPSNADRLRAFRNAVDDQTIMIGNAFRWPRQWRQL